MLLEEKNIFMYSVERITLLITESVNISELSYCFNADSASAHHPSLSVRLGVIGCLICHQYYLENNCWPPAKIMSIRQGCAAGNGSCHHCNAPYVKRSHNRYGDSALMSCSTCRQYHRTTKAFPSDTLLTQRRERAARKANKP